MNSDAAPIMRLGHNLLVSLQGDLDDGTVLRLEDQITREIVRTQAQGMLIDVSGLSIVDSFIARIIARITSMVRLLGSEAVVVGIQPAVAITLVELGVSMEHVHTALNAGRGMELLTLLQRADANGRR
ncbi:MAG: anti-anti-sigma factor [Myxococcaceae bacterium]|nr:anti-anti-sigma factor [Myxococcaceae bacterium]